MVSENFSNSLTSEIHMQNFFPPWNRAHPEPDGSTRGSSTVTRDLEKF